MRFAGVAGPTAVPPAGEPVRSVVFSNLVPFEARYDGHTLAVDPSRAALDEGARAVERAFTEALGPAFVAEARGALWYLTKYFTPHPPGEPHFFVKPWAFTRTPPGWSSLLEGRHGDGWDVLRGVVATDAFFATPAVFRVQRLGDPIRVGAGEPLLQVLPIPRRLLRAGYPDRRVAAMGLKALRARARRPRLRRGARHRPDLAPEEAARAPGPYAERLLGAPPAARSSSGSRSSPCRTADRSPRAPARAAAPHRQPDVRRPPPPAVQIMACVRPAARGGETLLVDSNT